MLGAASLVVVGFILSGLGGWLIGRLADSTLEKITDTGPIAVEMRGVRDADVLVDGEPDLSALAKSLHSEASIDGFLAGMNGTYVEGYGVTLTTYGTDDAPVLIRGVNASDVKCQRPLGSWTLLASYRGGGATPLPLTLRLSNKDDVAFGTTDGTWSFPRQVSPTDADLFNVFPVAPNGEICTFDITVEYTLKGEDAAKRIDRNGQPFRVGDKRVAKKVVQLADL